MKRHFIRVVAGLIVAGTLRLGAAAPQDNSGFMRITPAQIHWQDIPNAHGAQQAVLLGDPEKPGMYVVRVKFPRTSWTFRIGIRWRAT